MVVILEGRELKRLVMSAEHGDAKLLDRLTRTESIAGDRLPYIVPIRCFDVNGFSAANEDIGAAFLTYEGARAFVSGE